MVSKIGTKEFKNRIRATLIKVDGTIKENDLYFSQTTSGYYIEYKPEYPNRSNADFIVYQDLAGSISVHGNLSALVPTIEHYNDINDFERKMLINRCVECNNVIKKDYFNGKSGKICVNCLKKAMIYHGLKSLGLIETIEED